MFNGWKWFEDQSAAYADRPERNGSQADYWTNSPAKSWVDSNGIAWVLTYLKGTDELMLFPQATAGPVWISPTVPSVEATDSHLKGYEQAGGAWSWLTTRITTLPVA